MPPFNEIYATPKTKTAFTEDQILAMWPQAAGELQGFANHLNRGNMGITAKQIEMAIQLAQEAFAVRTSKSSIT